MDKGARSRSRAVRLTTAGLEVLRRTLVEVWARESNGRKLTRERRAELLGVSIATAERVLSGKGVDRATLLLAFKSLGLAWDEAYCEHPDAAPEAESDIQERPQLAPPAPSRPARSHPTGWARAFMVLITAMVMLSAPRSTRITLPEPYIEAWSSAYLRHFMSGTNAYHAGNYVQAKPHVDRALSIARANRSPSHTAGALRLAGDLASAHGDLHVALERYEEAYNLHKVFDATEVRPALLEALGDVRTRLGDFDGARTALTAALKGYSDLNLAVGITMALRNLGSLDEALGNLDAAERQFDDAARAIKSENKPDLMTDVRARRAVVWAKRGRLAAAHAELETCLAHWEEVKHARWIAKTLLQLATVDRLSGQAQSARQRLDRAEALYARVGDRMGVAAAQSLRAEMP